MLRLLLNKAPLAEINNLFIYLHLSTDVDESVDKVGSGRRHYVAYIRGVTKKLCDDLLLFGVHLWDLVVYIVKNELQA